MEIIPDSQEDPRISSHQPVIVATICANQSSWLSQWCQHVSWADQQIQVPPLARNVKTPLNIWAWNHYLSKCSADPLVQFFIKGISEGFRIGFINQDGNCRSARTNLQSALEHPHIVSEYLRKEVCEGRVAGPFNRSLAPSVHINRFGVIPKSHQPNKWRLIVDLSFPAHKSVNDGIPKELCSMSYVTIDDAIQKIISMGPDAKLAKVDIKHAFRLIPVHPADRHLLGMEWENYIFIDGCLPFGLRSAPKLFDIMAELLAGILQEQGVTYVIHYLDDFLTIGSPNSDECQKNLETMFMVSNALGIPLAVEKVAGPSLALEFLGIMLDTHRMEARLPMEKLLRTQQVVLGWLSKKNAKKRDILSLVGTLQHAAKVVRPGRTFVARLYAAAAKVVELEFYTRLNKGFRSDLWWWHTFLQHWNGASLLQLAGRARHEVLIQTDASGSWGCGAYCNGLWFQWEWPASWINIDITIKELVPVLLSCAVWGGYLKRKVVLFQCDNAAVVGALQKGSMRNDHAMHILRSLWFFVAFYDITLQAEHISGVDNCRADQLSRNNIRCFLNSNLQAHPIPTPLPQDLLEMAGSTMPDWTSQAFTKLFHSIVARDWQPQQ